MRHIPRLTPRHAALLLPALAACASGAGRAPAADASDLAGGYVVRLGTDTLVIESFAWTDTALTGEVLIRNPAPFVRTYTVRLAADGRPTRYESSVRPLSGTTPPASRAVIDVGADSARWEVNTTGQAPRRGAIAIPAGAGAVPFANNSFGVFSLMTRQALRAGGDSASVALMAAGAPQSFVSVVRRVGTDSVTVEVGGQAPYRVRVDGRGRVVGLQGLETTQKIVVERVGAVDMRAAEQSFATRALGPLSTRDSVATAVGAATVFVDYGRPFRRGRQVVGGIVPYDSVWRTGANFATVLRTDRDLVMGGTTIPAGKYTLWTLPTRSGWKLIVNRKTLDERGNPLWGTQYDATQDLARIDAQTEPLAQPVEQFTITVEPRAADAGAIRLAWDRTAVVVPFSVKP